VRVSFTTAPLTVGDDVPLSTVVGPNAVSLIGGASMDFLAKPPQSAGTTRMGDHNLEARSSIATCGMPNSWP
jgi:hypothetical protein